MKPPKDWATIRITEKNLKLFKQMYEKCPAGQCFEWQGQQILKEYARYLIEFVKMQTEE